MHTPFSHLTNEEFFRLLVSRKDLTPLEEEAMIRIENLMTASDTWEDADREDLVEETRTLRDAAADAALVEQWGCNEES